MNDDLQKALANNFNDLASWIKSAANASGDFIAREAPLFVQEYVAWVFWKNVFYTFAFLVATAIFCRITVWFHSKHKAFYANTNRSSFDESGWFVGTGIFMAASITAACLIVFNFVPNAIQAKVAPRVLLVEKAADLAGLNKGK